MKFLLHKHQNVAIRTRSLVEAGFKKKPQWLKVSEKFPPARWPAAPPKNLAGYRGKRMQIQFPEDRLREICRRTLGPRFSKNSAHYRWFARHQHGLMVKGLSEAQAFEQTKQDFREQQMRLKERVRKQMEKVKKDDEYLTLEEFMSTCSVGDVQGMDLPLGVEDEASKGDSPMATFLRLHDVKNVEPLDARALVANFADLERYSDLPSPAQADSLESSILNLFRLATQSAKPQEGQGEDGVEDPASNNDTGDTKS